MTESAPVLQLVRILLGLLKKKPTHPCSRNDEGEAVLRHLRTAVAHVSQDCLQYWEVALALLLRAGVAQVVATCPSAELGLVSLTRKGRRQVRRLLEMETDAQLFAHLLDIEPENFHKECSFSTSLLKERIREYLSALQIPKYERVERLPERDNIHAAELFIDASAWPEKGAPLLSLLKFIDFVFGSPETEILRGSEIKRQYPPEFAELIECHERDTSKGSKLEEYLACSELPVSRKVLTTILNMLRDETILFVRESANLGHCSVEEAPTEDNEDPSMLGLRADTWGPVLALNADPKKHDKPETKREKKHRTVAGELTPLSPAENKAAAAATENFSRRPRRTHKELATELKITPGAFSQNLRRAETKLQKAGQRPPWKPKPKERGSRSIYLRKARRIHKGDEDRSAHQPYQSREGQEEPE